MECMDCDMQEVSPAVLTESGNFKLKFRVKKDKEIVLIQFYDKKIKSDKFQLHVNNHDNIQDKIFY